MVRQKLTEEEKLRRATDRRNAKVEARATKGMPLFAKQIKDEIAGQMMTPEAFAWKKRREAALYADGTVQGGPLHERAEPHHWTHQPLYWISRRAIERWCRQFLPDEDWQALVAYRAKTFPNSLEYDASFWYDTLALRRRTVYEVRWVAFPPGSVPAGRLEEVRAFQAATALISREQWEERFPLDRWKRQDAPQPPPDDGASWAIFEAAMRTITGRGN